MHDRLIGSDLFRFSQGLLGFVVSPECDEVVDDVEAGAGVVWTQTRRFE